MPSPVATNRPETTNQSPSGTILVSMKFSPWQGKQAFLQHDFEISDPKQSSDTYVGLTNNDTIEFKDIPIAVSPTNIDQTRTVTLCAGKRPNKQNGNSNHKEIGTICFALRDILQHPLQSQLIPSQNSRPCQVVITVDEQRPQDLCSALTASPSSPASPSVSKSPYQDLLPPSSNQPTRVVNGVGVTARNGVANYNNNSQNYLQNNSQNYHQNSQNNNYSRNSSQNDNQNYSRNNSQNNDSRNAQKVSNQPFSVGDESFPPSATSVFRETMQSVRSRVVSGIAQAQQAFRSFTTSDPVKAFYAGSVLFGLVVVCFACWYVVASPTSVIAPPAPTLPPLVFSKGEVEELIKTLNNTARLEVEKVIKERDDRIALLSKLNSDLKDETDKLSFSNKQLSDDKTQLLAKISGLNERVSTLEQQNDKLEREGKKIDGLKVEIREKEEANKALSDQNTQLKSDYQGVQDRLKTLQTTVGELNEKVGSLESDNSLLTTRNARLKTENAELTTSNGLLQDQKNELTTANGVLEKEKERLAKENQGLVVINGQLVSDKEHLSNENQNLRNQTTTQGHVIMTLDEKVGVLLGSLCFFSLIMVAMWCVYSNSKGSSNSAEGGSSTSEGDPSTTPGTSDPEHGSPIYSGGGGGRQRILSFQEAAQELSDRKENLRSGQSDAAPIQCSDAGTSWFIVTVTNHTSRPAVEVSMHTSSIKSALISAGRDAKQFGVAVFFERHSRHPMVTNDATFLSDVQRSMPFGVNKESVFLVVNGQCMGEALSNTAMQSCLSQSEWGRFLINSSAYSS